MAAELVNRLKPIVADAVTAAGFELDSIEVQQAKARKLVTVVIDGADGVGSEQVATVSRAVSKALDQHEDLLAGAYTLEVTSPGVTRPLTCPRHWRRAKYRQVRITPNEGAQYLARVGTAGERAVQVLVNGVVHELAYGDVAQAVVEVEFRQPPAEELRKLEGGSDTKDTKEESR